MTAGLPGILLYFGGRKDMLETRDFTVEELDYEWMMLILEAKKLGIKKDEIRRFLDENEIRD